MEEGQASSTPTYTLVIHLAKMEEGQQEAEAVPAPAWTPPQWTAEELFDKFGWGTSLLDAVKDTVKVIRADDDSFPKISCVGREGYSYHDWKFVRQLFERLTRDQLARLRVMLAKTVQRGIDDGCFSSSRVDDQRVRSRIPAVMKLQAELDKALGEPCSVVVWPPPPQPPQPEAVAEVRGAGADLVFICELVD